MTDKTRGLLRAVIVTLLSVVVGAALLLLLGHDGAWRRVSYESVIGSLFQYVLAYCSLLATYHFARFAATYETERSSKPGPLEAYLRCVLACGALGLVLGFGLGTHVEDADPLRGGGEIVVDFEPSALERATFGLKVFLGSLLPGLYGTADGLKADRDAAKKGSAK